MQNKISRKDAIKSILAGVGVGIATPILLTKFYNLNYKKKENKTLQFKSIHRSIGNPRIKEPITAITIGAGARGNTYGNYALNFPNELKIIGVAEPIDIRKKRFCEKHNIDKSQSFKSWEEIFNKPKFADAVIICTPDHLHYGPCIKALEMGYDILLEKPIAQTEKECREILRLQKKNNNILAVCHVLRYAPYFINLKHLIDSGIMGEIISVQHIEPIEHIHMSHSYVRGNWHDSKKSTPIILAKSCHDLDILRWLIDKKCESISAFGNLKWFTSKNAPKGSTDRCNQGCKVEPNCPYSALKIYYRERRRTFVFDLPENESKHGDYILRQLSKTNYGRCVYKMDNNQPDHYVVSMEFEGGVTANFSMEALTSYDGRRTRIMGSLGDVVGDMNEFIYTNFLTGEKTKWSIENDPNTVKDFNGHGGGDLSLVTDWVLAVKTKNLKNLSSTIDASIESHLMGFAAEESRLNKQVVKII